MLAFDASSLIYAWDNYPPEQFPGLWEWLAGRIASGEFVASKVALKEVKDKLPECASWLRRQSMQGIDVDDPISTEAMRIQGLLGIVGDAYHPKGVDENDILIIATAHVRDLTLVSEEATQPTAQRDQRKLKIPAVCELPDVGVECINFIQLIKRSEVVFR